MRKTVVALFIIALAAAGPALAAENTRWLNVNVTEHEEGTKVQVHLPMNLVLQLVQAVNVEQIHGGKVDMDIGDTDVDWPKVFEAIKTAPDGDFVKVDSPEADVLVSKKAGTVTIDVNQKEDEHAIVKVTVPASLIDSLHVDDHNEIDVAAFLKGLDNLPNGDLVTVESSEANVRVWIE